MELCHSRPIVIYIKHRTTLILDVLEYFSLHQHTYLSSNFHIQHTTHIYFVVESVSVFKQPTVSERKGLRFTTAQV